MNDCGSYYLPSRHNPILPPHLRTVVYRSALLRQLSWHAPFVTHLADSLYVMSTNTGAAPPAA
jgi:hypothetical protein